LDKPLHEQFALYLGKVLRGDLGTSYRTRLPVTREMAPHVMPTVHLALGGMFLALLIGVPAGIISAYRPNTLLDYVTLSGAMIGLSAPNFWLGIVLIYFLAFRLPILPMIGEGEPGSVLRHLVLPSIVIGSGSAALLARITRSAMLEAMANDYVRTAFAKGVREPSVVLKHVLRNALIPIVSTGGTMFALLLTGSVVVESVFSRRGLGRLLVHSIFNRDFPMVQGLVLLFGVAIVVTNLLTDLWVSRLDPRISYE
jgi:ABC-type dipeptide/oligopeptide/nickel transport system permease component